MSEKEADANTTVKVPSNKQKKHLLPEGKKRRGVGPARTLDFLLGKVRVRHWIQDDRVWMFYFPVSLTKPGALRAQFLTLRVLVQERGSCCTCCAQKANTETRQQDEGYCYPGDATNSILRNNTMMLGSQENRLIPVTPRPRPKGK